MNSAKKTNSDASVTPVFEPGQLDLLKSYTDANGVDLRKSLVDTFLQNAPREMDQLVAARTQSAETFFRIAHTLKSSSASVGGIHLALIFERMELSGPTHPETENNLAQIRGEFENLKTSLQKYFSEQKG